MPTVDLQDRLPARVRREAEDSHLAVVGRRARQPLAPEAAQAVLQLAARDALQRHAAGGATRGGDDHRGLCRAGRSERLGNPPLDFFGRDHQQLRGACVGGDARTCLRRKFLTQLFQRLVNQRWLDRVIADHGRANLGGRRFGDRLIQGFDQLAGDPLRGLAALDQDAVAVLVYHDLVTRAFA